MSSLDGFQRRFRHRFEPVRQEHAIRHIQERVNAYWVGVKEREGS